MNGQLALYELCLRPKFFRHCTAQQRLEVLIHELWHIHPNFDGRLDPARRHAAAKADASRHFVDEVLSLGAAQLVTEPLLNREGLWRLPMWLDRPPSLIPPRRRSRDSYETGADLFDGLVEQLSRSDPGGQEESESRA